MKYLFIVSLVAFLFSGLGSCSLGTTDGSMKLKDTPKDIALEKEVAAPVEISIDRLVGSWIYTEVRTTVNEEGPSPMGEMLLGITADHTLSFATEGIEELKENLVGVPSSFEIRDNRLCALDMNAEVDFKLSFKNMEVKCYLLNDNEMILGKEGENSPMPIYMYFKRFE
jgi:hypothetical protein